jgi:3-deoxy-7-phosphoheptulonate synthase
VDVFQVGSRNMQNFPLLTALGETDKPVLLKRGMAATLDEFLCAAEYILLGGNSRVILCERGIRGFDAETRNVLDLGGMAALKRMTHLPVIVDPSHAAGRRDIIPDLAKAAVACGADGLMIEVHPNPEQSFSDAEQALSLTDFSHLLTALLPVAEAVGRTMPVACPTALAIVP